MARDLSRFDKMKRDDDLVTASSAFWPYLKTREQIVATDIKTRTIVVACLEQFLRDERHRGLMGHWTYSAGRHYGLVEIYNKEKAALEAALSEPMKEAAE